MDDPKAPPEKQTVLVVDDFADGREMYAEFLEFQGFNVQTAKDGQEAVTMAREGHPDLILMDLSLPYLDGLAATRLLKGDAATRDIPVVALTGHVLGGQKSDAEEAGCEGFISKPALPADVEQRIRALLSRKPLKP